jgi:competence ComEA-like helix-hairpin-helix protein
MRTGEERRAAFVLLALAGAGLLVRLLAGGGAPPGEVAYRSITGGRLDRDSVAARAARLARPLAPGEKIDLDSAPADELVRLPRIGPALARRIVAYRENHGPFGMLEAVEAVPGVGPTTLEALRTHAAFSGRSIGRPQQAANPLVSLNTASAAELAQLPGIGPARARAILEDRRRRGPYRRLDDLTRVRGIGAGTIARLRGRVRLP